MSRIMGAGGYQQLKKNPLRFIGAEVGGVIKKNTKINKIRL